MPSPYQGVILAAGQGSRMGPLADHYPKALLPVANVPLIVRHVETLRTLGVEEIFVVVGHLAPLIESALGAGDAWGVSIRYVHQQERHGLAHAIAPLEGHLSGPFYLLLGDICFAYAEPAAAARLFEGQTAAAVLAVENNAELVTVQRNFSVEMGEDGRVRRVIEKPASAPARCKGCGFYLFDGRIFDAIRRTPRSSLRNEYELTDAIQTLINDGAPVFGVAMTAWDVNITEPSDLITCNVRELARLATPHLIGSNCDISSGVELDRTTVGDGVRIAHPIRLERCVVLPGTVVDSQVDLLDKVIAPGLIAG